MEEERIDLEVEVDVEVSPQPICPFCNGTLRTDQPLTGCDWCDQGFHRNCEPMMQTCPNCTRYLPTAKKKALSRDRKRTALLLISLFVIVEIIIAVISWLNHPSLLSVPDIEKWLSVGLIVNVILLIVAFVAMGIAAFKGEGQEELEPRSAPSK